MNQYKIEPIDTQSVQENYRLFRSVALAGALCGLGGFFAGRVSGLVEGALYRDQLEYTNTVLSEALGKKILELDALKHNNVEQLFTNTLEEKVE